MKGSTTATVGTDNKDCIELAGDVFSQKVKINICVLLCNFLREQQKIYFLVSGSS